MCGDSRKGYLKIVNKSQICLSIVRLLGVSVPGCKLNLYRRQKYKPSHRPAASNKKRRVCTIKM